MNFLFILNLFLFKNIKISFYICDDVVDGVASAYVWTCGDVCAQHVATCGRNMYHTCAHHEWLSTPFRGTN